MLTTTAQRVRVNTAAEINEQIDRGMERRLKHYAHSDLPEIDRRLAELDAEWDIERCLEGMASSLSLTGLLLGVTRSRNWLIVPGVVQSFLLVHALQGWCPPLPVLRRLGVRTSDEINQERYALKALRGDFQNISAGNAMAAIER